MTEVVRKALFALLFYPGTLVFVLSGMVASLIGTGPTLAVVHGWARFHRLLNQSLGIRVKVIGTIPRGPHLVAVKHQSMYETIEMLLIAEMPVIVAKRELSEMPLFGWMMRRYGVIPVDRQAGPKALRRMLALGKQAIAEQRPVIIFPEGTRVRAGEAPPLQAGFAGLYRALGLPVVPVAMDSGKLWGPNLPTGSGTVHFLVGEVIPAGLKRDEVEARVHAAINALEQLAP